MVYPVGVLYLSPGSEKAVLVMVCLLSGGILEGCSFLGRITVNSPGGNPFYSDLYGLFAGCLN